MLIAITPPVTRPLAVRRADIHSSPMNELSDRFSVPVRARIPAGERVYAIGDIHGRDDLLAALHAGIADDLARMPIERPVVVYLGDYVDRGPESFEVIDRLIHGPLPRVQSVHLKGNHEQMMLDFLDDGADGTWLENGGDATLASYGVPPPHPWADADELQEARLLLRAAVPENHLHFLRGLQLWFSSGGYVFVHAGIHPERPLEEQVVKDLMWIRGPFLSSKKDFGVRVVHGHSITREPDVQHNRIGIDTGAFYSGRLTCLVLEGETMRFLGR
jgi:serine/threonine protein phosphatase 1